MFKRSIIPIFDVLKGLNKKKKRIKLINSASTKPIPKTYGINELAKSLHPGYVDAHIERVLDATKDSKLLLIKSESGKFPFFRAGQFITISVRIGESLVTRAYSLSSSPFEAFAGQYEIIVQDCGFVSHYLCSAKEGMKVLVGEPTGDFAYDDIRDKKHILAIAGGSGVTPFISMAKSLEEGSDDFCLTILYGAKTKDDLMINEETFSDPRVNVVPVLSEEENPKYLHGFIDKAIIAKYYNEETSIFMCGPNAMYNFVSKEIDCLGIDINSVRKEHNVCKDLKISNPNEYNIIVHMRDQVYNIKGLESETILVALERAGLAAPSRCRSGVCGFCHSRLISGSVYQPEEFDHRRIADKVYGYIHPCCTYPTSDLEIDVPPQDALKEIK